MSGWRGKTIWDLVDAAATGEAGAALVQVYSSLVFKGLGLIEEIKRDLVSVLERTKHKSLSEIVGADAAQITAEPWPI